MVDTKSTAEKEGRKDVVITAFLRKGVEGGRSPPPPTLFPIGGIQRKTLCMGPYAGVDCNLILYLTQSRLQHI